MLFRPSIIRSISFVHLENTVHMIRNYVKLALRNLRKHQLHSTINVIGLALGLSAFLLITLYTDFERSYDDFHYHPNHLYRITTDEVKDGKIGVRDAMSFSPSGKVLEEELPQIVASTCTYKTFRMIFRKENQPIEENLVTAVDSNFLNLFRYPVIRGDKASMLSEPYSMVLTESQAAKYFNDRDPIGQSIHVLGSFNRPFQITGIIKDVPENTHYKFNTLVSLKSYEERVRSDNWNGFNYYTYVQLDNKANPDDIRAQLPALSRKYIGEDSNLDFNLQPVRDIHLKSDFTYEPEIHGSLKAIRFLGIISILILLIAWINYINLSTARALERAKEVGLRKVVGARRAQLIGQFFTESALINMAAALLAMIFSQLAIPYFNELIGKSVVTDVWNHSVYLKWLGVFFLTGTLITGIYPAFVLSSFKPLGIIQGSFGRSNQGVKLRKGLVVVQFATSLVLIAATITVFQQIKHMTSMDLGIDTDQVIGFTNPSVNRDDREAYRSQYQAFANEVERIGGVERVGNISSLPGGGSADISSSSGGIRIVGLTDRMESTIYQTSMNDMAISALGIELIAGRNFDHELASDTAAVILNESIVQQLGIDDPDRVVNQYVQFGRNPENDRFLIAGVIKDFNRTSLKRTVEPTVFFHNEVTGNSLVRFSGDQVHVVSGQIKDLWRQFFPSAPLEINFLDQRFEKLYLEDRKFGFIFGNFAILAIIVAILGLFGLSSYLSLQRTKEVGVRKVLGASVSNIVLMFFNDFARLIMIAFVIGIPFVYVGMSEWLEGYAYRIDFPWWVLIVSVIAVVLMAFCTVSYQTYRIAALNPAKTIRHE